MLSLRFPIPIENTLTPSKPHLPRSRCTRTQTRLFPSPSSYPTRLASSLPAAATTTEVAVQRDDPAEAAWPAELREESMPRHVAVIMDGNGRWARKRGLPTGKGHEEGVRSLRELIELCCRWGIKVLTVFAFSYDNWTRPKVEVEFLMNLFERGIKSELENFVREDIRISVIGDSTKLPKTLQKLIADAEEATKSNTRLQLIVAVSYSGKYDVVQACTSIARKVRDGLIQLDDINESLIEQELETKCSEFPEPDLLIRTSGERRISNFLLWQLAYTELFFAQPLWPDFGKAEFIEALSSFQQRQRRFGGRDS